MQTFLLSIMPVMAATTITISYLPQMWMTFKTKNVESQHIGFWLLLTFSLSCLVSREVGVLMYTDGISPLGFVTQSINLVFSAIMLVMVLKYKKKDVEYDEYN